MKKLVVGILAHVDAGKTTLSEGLLYRSGRLKALGRVDHGSAFLDTETQERERGITIFSKQAVLPLENLEVTLLDTPGHVDFSSEMERTLQVLDCAILVVSGPDGVQGHTRTLWRLLERCHIPTFLFINKMDQPGADRAGLLARLRAGLADCCVDFDPDRPRADFFEEAALCGEEALGEFLDRGAVGDGTLRALIGARKLFPCYFGSALRLEGVDALLAGLERYAPAPRYPEEFGATVYKIARDVLGARLTYLKVTGGALRVKDVLSHRDGAGAEQWEEKVDQIRIYSGAKFRTVEEAGAGTVCAVTGLSRTCPGQGLGAQVQSAPPVLEPVLTYQVLLPAGCEAQTALPKLRQLAEEDPQLHVVWNPRLREIHVQLMGQVQLEVLRRLILERFGLEISFGAGSIVYRETIAAPVVGVGHYEPLRHYAEVHLLLEPGERGSGLTLAARCPEEMLERGWQRLVLSHLAEREHPGVLTGAPITDMRITLVAGRAHVKHTEGGDFRQATYRAVRQGLMEAESVLLEPWYDFTLELPAAHVGRALSDLQRMSAVTAPPALEGEEAVLSGSAPVAGLRDYAGEVAAYTRGRGRLFCTAGGYRPCHNQAEAVERAGYDPERDVDNPADSVFCAHGAGYVVRWDEAPTHMHVDSGLRPGEPEPEQAPREAPARGGGYAGTLEQDKELQAIFERTYGPVKRRSFLPQAQARREPEPEPEEETRKIDAPGGRTEYLLVDGYNIIYAWEELKVVARDNLDAARQLLMDLLCNYRGFKTCEVILVFDAYRVRGGQGEVSRYHNITVVYTREAETADAYIEKATYEIGTRHRVRVATSDGAEQLIILGHGALRLSAGAFKTEVEQVAGQISAALARNNRREKSQPVRAALEKARGAGGP